MSLTRFTNPSLRDKQEVKDEVSDPRLEKLEKEVKVEKKPVKKAKK